MTVIKHMRGIWLEDRSLRVRDDLPVPVPTANEALIRVLQAGICGTDLQLLKGYYPFTGIPGHEFVGEVVQASAAPALNGKRVVGEINIGCGQCHLCLAGLERHCNTRSVLGIKQHQGAFSQYLTLPVKNLHIVPDTVSNDQAVFVEPIAAAARILEQVNITADTCVLIIGAGRLGLLIAQVLKTTSCRLAVVVRHEKQRQLLNTFSIPAIAEHEVTTGNTDVVVEASGSAAGLHAAVRAVKPTGTIVLKSTYSGDTSFQFSSVVVNEITLIGSRCGPFPPALTLLQKNQVDPLPLIRARFTFGQYADAFASATQPGALKVLLQPD
jgi:2-desacetyl-2-hydroxyethyl bacteriochlorophyllide A dehydrogenase